MDWRSILFDSTRGLFKHLDALARRRFPTDPNLAEEAFNAVLDALSRDDWARLARFDGRGSAEGYLVRAFSHALEDFARQRFGRPRPPATIARRGGMWLRIYQQLIVERRLEPSIIDALVADTEWSVADITEAIREVKALCQSATNLGAFVPLEDNLDPAAIREATVDPPPEPERQLQRSLRERLAHGLSRLFDATHAAAGDDQGVEVDAEDRVLIRLLYAEGLSLAASARLLGRPEHEVRRRHQHLLKVLRQQLPPAAADLVD
ncbi:MAG: helix-turn-helix domain-containing protein [Candidatus Contendobacter sp.]|nr:helix-turn-helix domain-containing protein [Candidatus Contendobacter sp.]